jgi:hypothetical protein
MLEPAWIGKIEPVSRSTVRVALNTGEILTSDWSNRGHPQENPQGAIAEDLLKHPRERLLESLLSTNGPSVKSTFRGSSVWVVADCAGWRRTQPLTARRSRTAATAGCISRRAPAAPAALAIVLSPTPSAPTGMLAAVRILRVRVHSSHCPETAVCGANRGECAPKTTADSAANSGLRRWATYAQRSQACVRCVR